MRIGIGVAWLVVVAAEMIALRSGLGYLIMDSRNAGNRYDLVIASMIIIGADRPAAGQQHAPAGAAEDREVALCPLKRKIVVSGVQQELRLGQGRAAGDRRT